MSDLFGHASKPIELRSYQQHGIELLRTAIRKGSRRPLLVAPTGCHAAGTKILMADGRLCAVEHICVGDAVMGPDSKRRTVTALHRGIDDMYRVVPVKGEPFVVNGDHVLALRVTNDGSKRAGKVDTVTVREWLSSNATYKHTRKLFRVGVEFPYRSLPVHPYMLGVILGDGCIRAGAIVANPDEEIRVAMAPLAKAAGLKMHEFDRGDRCPTFSLVTAIGKPNHLIRHLKSMGLMGCDSYGKFVPWDYKICAAEQRLELLSGLMDTDGSLANGIYDFVSASRRLADDVVFLARSVGLAAYMSECTKKWQGGVGQYWRVCISGDVSRIPCRVERKKAAPRKQIKNPLVTGFHVEPIGVGTYYGFECSDDHLYVMGDFTVTHNSGKTTWAADIIRSAVAKGGKALFLAPRRELVYQASARLRSAGIAHGVLMAQAEHLENFDAPVQVGSIDTLIARLFRQRSKIELPAFTLILVDECFPAGTLVEGTPIENIRPGHRLSTGEVIAVSRKPASVIVRVRTESGATVTCTPSHPFMTANGWRYAIELGLGDALIARSENLHASNVRNERGREETLPAVQGDVLAAAGETMAEHMLGSLPQAAPGQGDLIAQSWRGEAGEDREQPHEEARGAPEGFDLSASNVVGADRAQREWPRPNATRKGAGGSTGHGVACGRCDEDAKGFGISDVLQAGHGLSGLEDWHRSGWQQPQFHRETGAGCQEIGILDLDRVVSVEVFEQGRGSEFERLCPGGEVFNLEVAGSAVYFANGFLVHNCHLAITQRRNDLLAHWPNAMVIGLTATPVRKDGRALGLMFDELVQPTSVRELIDAGYLVKPRYFSLSQPDLARVRITAGDYNAADLEEAVNKSELVGDIVQHWMEHAGDRRTVVFCTSIKHSVAVCEAFLRQGVAAEHVDANTPNDEREAIFKRFTSGDTQLLTNCLAGETEVLTQQGVRPIRELAGGSHTILTRRNKVGISAAWVSAEFRSFGVQPLMRITFQRGKARKEVYATPGHGWLIETGASVERIETVDLVKGMRPQTARAHSYLNTGINPSPVGIQHGIWYGDGSSAPADRNVNSMRLCGPAKAELVAHFSGYVIDRPEWASGDVVVRGGPNFFKALPSMTETAGYLLGWLMGYFATDGCVSDGGRMILSSADEQSIQRARDVASVLGIGTWTIRKQIRKTEYIEQPEPMWLIGLRQETVDESFFLNPLHLERYRAYEARMSAGVATGGCGEWKVEKVEATDRVEEVFCATVPDTHNFTLTDEIVTGNCFLASYGFDLPELSCVVLARPTKSLMLYLQMLGRGLRPAPGKDDCLVLDHAGCVHLHGFAEQDREWSLDGAYSYDDKQSGDSERNTREVKPIECPECHAVFSKTPVCPECGYRLKTIGQAIETLDGKLVEIGTGYEVKPKPAGSLKFYLELRGYAQERGYKSGWAGVNYKKLYNDWPPRAWEREEALLPSPATVRWVKSQIAEWRKTQDNRSTAA